MPCAVGPHEPESSFIIHLRPRKLSLQWLHDQPGLAGIAIEAHTLKPSCAVPHQDAPTHHRLEWLKEEETFSIATCHEQPISQAASNAYVIADEGIRHSRAIDLPSVLRRVPGLR